jgi:hypothetical protein
MTRHAACSCGQLHLTIEGMTLFVEEAGARERQGCRSDINV